MQDAFRVLERRSLIERDKKTDNITIHRLLQVAFRYSEFGLNSQSRLQDAISATAILLNNRFPKHIGSQSLHGRWDVCAAYLSHVRSLVHAFESFKRRNERLVSTPPLDELLKNCCWYLYEAGLYSEGTSLLTFATQHSLAKTGLNHAKTDLNDAKTDLNYATLCQAYACMDFELNNLPEARYWNEQCLKIRKSHLKDDDPDIANVHANLTNVLTGEGRFDSAIEEMGLAMRHLSMDCSSDLVYIAMRKMMLGRAHFYNGEVDTAQKCYEESEEVFAKCEASDTFLRSL